MRFFAMAMAAILLVLAICLSSLLVIATFKKVDEIKTEKTEVKSER